MNAPRTPDLVTLTLPRDVAREQLRSLEEVLEEMETLLALSKAHGIFPDVLRTKEHLAQVDQLREALHAALYCTAREVL